MVIYHPKKQYTVSAVGDLTFTGIVFSWFSLTWRRKDQEQDLQLSAVQNCGQVSVNLWCEVYFIKVKTPPIHASYTYSGPDLTSNLQGSYLQTHRHRVSSERINPAYKSTYYDSQN